MRESCILLGHCGGTTPHSKTAFSVHDPAAFVRLDSATVAIDNELRISRTSEIDLPVHRLKHWPRI